LLREQLKVWVASALIATATIVALPSRTSCDLDGYISICNKGNLRVPFFYVLLYN
jgi:hypothetical protein